MNGAGACCVWGRNQDARSIAAAHPVLMDRAAIDARASFHLHRDIMARISIYTGKTKADAAATRASADGPACETCGRPLQTKGSRDE